MEQNRYSKHYRHTHTKLKVQGQFNEEKIVFSTNGLGISGHPYTKKKLKIDIYLDIKLKTVKFLEENIVDKPFL